MTRNDAIAAYMNDAKVCGGTPGTEDYDEGRIVDVAGDTVEVAWDSGVKTRQHVSVLSPVA
jgi:hypothetical protein